MVRVKVRAWNREKIVYGSSVTLQHTSEMEEVYRIGEDILAMGFEVNQKKASMKYWTFCGKISEYV